MSRAGKGAWGEQVASAELEPWIRHTPRVWRLGTGAGSGAGVGLRVGADGRGVEGIDRGILSGTVVVCYGT